MQSSQHVVELRQILNKHFKWNKARITCFTKMIIGLFMVRTVNLTELALAFDGTAKYLSRYRRLQRFFSGFKIDYEVIALFIFGLFDFQEFYISMDRTNWKWGKKKINILMVAIVYKGTAIPIIWDMLNKNGNSNTKERIEIMKRFISYFGKNCIKGILADREFIGNDWLTWLLKEKISFYIRIKDNTITTNAKGGQTYVNLLFRNLKINEQLNLKGKRKIWGHKLYLSGLKLEDKKNLIIITNDNQNESITIYSKRWEIETLFGCLKGRGFNFEDTHITEMDRINKMIVLLAISFCWAHKTGEWQHKIEPIKIKSHKRLSRSFFRYGLDYIRESIFVISSRFDMFKKCLNQLLYEFDNYKESVSNN